MADYELNGDSWYYRGHEYGRGHKVTIPADLGGEDSAFVQHLVEAGTLVEVGHAEKLRKEQEQADQERADLQAAQVERDDAEAHRVVDVEQQRLSGSSPQGDNRGSDAGSDTSTLTSAGDGPPTGKRDPAPTRRTSK